MSTSEKVKVPFRHRKLWGIPAPIVAACLAVLLIAGAALAFITLRAPARIDGQVQDAKVVWTTSTPPTTTAPFVGRLSGVSTVSVSINASGELVLTNINAYRGGSFHVWALFNATIDGLGFHIKDVDLGQLDTAPGTPGPNAAYLTVEVIESTDPGFFTTSGESTSYTSAAAGATLIGKAELVDPGLNGVHFKVSIKDTAPPGPFGSVTVPVGGLIIESTS